MRNQRDWATTMKPEDYSIFRQVQGILVRNYVNTQRLTIDVINATVYIEGEFMLFDAVLGHSKNDPVERDAAAKQALMQIDREIRQTTPADTVRFKLTNWERFGLRWMRR